MRGYIIVEVDVHDPVRYEDYKRMVPASLEKYGGRFIVRGGNAELLEGSPEPKRIVVLEFPSADAAKAWWNSPEYAEAKALRQSLSQARLIAVEGCT